MGPVHNAKYALGTCDTTPTCKPETMYPVLVFFTVTSGRLNVIIGFLPSLSVIGYEMPTSNSKCPATSARKKYGKASSASMSIATDKAGNIGITFTCDTELSSTSKKSLRMSPSLKSVCETSKPILIPNVSVVVVENSTSPIFDNAF